ncbi:MAG: hypothetical protein VKL20_00155 [Synechocystis sp.]|nr:hypothetical protein [Synechocystis sp.]
MSQLAIENLDFCQSPPIDFRFVEGGYQYKRSPINAETDALTKVEVSVKNRRVLVGFGSGAAVAVGGNTLANVTIGII